MRRQWLTAFLCVMFVVGAGCNTEQPVEPCADVEGPPSREDTTCRLLMLSASGSFHKKLTRAQAEQLADALFALGNANPDNQEAFESQYAMTAKLCVKRTGLSCAEILSLPEAE